MKTHKMVVLQPLPGRNKWKEGLTVRSSPMMMEAHVMSQWLLVISFNYVGSTKRAIENMELIITVTIKHG